MRKGGRRVNGSVIREKNGRVSRRYLSGSLDCENDFRKEVVYKGVKIDVKRVYKGVVMIGGREFPAAISLPLVKFCEK